MQLITLGSLGLEGAPAFRRLKPLLLLSFLCLEGPQDRRFLAELFWPGASDALNSLSVALGHVRRAAPKSVASDELRAWALVACDVDALLGALETRAYGRAVDLYRGPFLAGVRLLDWGAELEEWVYTRREDLAARVRRALLHLAEEAASHGRFAEAAGRAEAGYMIAGAAEPEPEELGRFYALLLACDSPLATRVLAEAEGLGLQRLSPAEARARLERALFGREREQTQLLGLRGGEWAWLRGGAGMGKTVLLRSLEGVYLPGRSGLPYATLAPLVGAAAQGSEVAMLRDLSARGGLWLVDNWERVDAESQELLRRLRAQGTRARVVIAAREAPALRVDTLLELSPLSPDMLASYPGAWETTKGLPPLVDAFMRGEPLAIVFERQLDQLSAKSCRVLLALALLDQPDLALVRRALGLGAPAMAAAVEELLRASLIEPVGQVRLRQAAQAYLDAHPTQLGPLALALARELGDLEAFSLYRRSRLLWRNKDKAKAGRAYLAWAQELLRRGFAQRAADILEEAPQQEGVAFLKARALEWAGQYQDALDCLAELAASPEVQALRGTLLWRLGKPGEARKAAEDALGGEMAARAEAQNTLGNLAFDRGDYVRAGALYRRASALWLALDEHGPWVRALLNLAKVRAEQGEKADEAYGEALAAAGENLALKAMITLNLGVWCEQQARMDEAAAHYQQTISLAEKAGDIILTGKAWNNLGNLFESHDREQAKDAYVRALKLARRAGEKLLTGVALANLAELEGDDEAWEEAMSIFEATGNQVMAERYWAQLPEDHPVRLRAGKS